MYIHIYIYIYIYVCSTPAIITARFNVITRLPKVITSVSEVVTGVHEVIPEGPRAPTADPMLLIAISA